MPLNHPKIAEQLKSSAGELASLGAETEGEFLQIGTSLQGLADTCFTLHGNADRLTSLSSFRMENDSGEEGSFLEETRAIFAEVAHNIHATLETLADGDHLLLDILTEVANLKQPVQDLYSVGKTFKVLGISIKVESSRDESARHGFHLLADEVAQIAVQVNENCHSCEDKADKVSADIHRSRLALDSRGEENTQGGEQAIEAILQTLEEVGQKSEFLASGIEERSQLMVEGIGDAVMAMQFHDISRQQLENVARALTETSDKVGSLGEANPSGGEEQAVLEMYGILSLQVAHLNSIYEQIIAARQQIELGLKRTMEQAELQAEDAATLLKMDERSGNRTVVVKLEEEINKIVHSLNKALSVVHHAAEVSRGVYATVSEIGDFVKTIEGIAFDVKILAINAMVEAIKTGESGRTLTVLAKELSALSLETRDGALSSIKTLQRIMERTEKQLEFSTALDQNREVTGTIIARAKSLTATILSSMQEVGTLAATMDTSSRTLSSAITRLLPGIRFPELMGERISRNWQLLCEVLDLIEERYPQFCEKNIEVEQMMEKLSQQYVMDRERSIHAQVAGGALDDEGNAGGDIELFGDDEVELFEQESLAEEQGEGEEFGDNVELF